MEILKPADDFHAGISGQEFRETLKEKTKSYPEKKYCLDLSEVTYMDTYTFRLVFDYMPKINKIIPPKDKKVIEMYNFWVDSKKDLKK